MALFDNCVLKTSDADITESLETLALMFRNVDREVLETCLRVERNFDKVVEMVQMQQKQGGGGLKKKGQKKGIKLPLGQGNVWGVTPNSTTPADLSQCLSTKLKREKLTQMFPMLPEELREAAFRRNKSVTPLPPRKASPLFVLTFFFFSFLVVCFPSYRLEATRAELCLHIGERYLRSFLFLIFLRFINLVPVFRPAERPVPVSTKTAAPSQVIPKEPPRKPDLQTADSYHANASEFAEERNNYFRRAASAFRKGDRGVAAYYAEEGHKFNEKMRDANVLAAKSIISERMFVSRRSFLLTPKTEPDPNTNTVTLN